MVKSSKGIKISSVHGDFLINEPVLIDLINSPAFERLKKIRQYGTCDYGYPTNITYWRYDHCIGSMLLIRKYGGDLRTQIAALLHDVSHTAFSHSVDPLFMGGFTKGAYQDKIHTTFLKERGLEAILL
ncbi:MAG: HD domain-containing protein, partial [Alphaproteobacteria bacterium]|nr:HD domain-containing protein [Alphaproteobacteria bacterium]